MQCAALVGKEYVTFVNIIEAAYLVMNWPTSTTFIINIFIHVCVCVVVNNSLPSAIINFPSCFD